MHIIFLNMCPVIHKLFGVQAFCVIYFAQDALGTACPWRSHGSAKDDMMRYCLEWLCTSVLPHSFLADQRQLCAIVYFTIQHDENKGNLVVSVILFTIKAARLFQSRSFCQTSLITGSYLAFF